MTLTSDLENHFSNSHSHDEFCVASFIEMCAMSKEMSHSQQAKWGWTDDRQLDRQPENIIPPAPVVDSGGIKMLKD